MRPKARGPRPAGCSPIALICRVGSNLYITHGPQRPPKTLENLSESLIRRLCAVLVSPSPGNRTARSPSLKLDTAVLNRSHTSRFVSHQESSCDCFLNKMLQMSPETPPKYKRRKIFAIRQFPPGCSTSAVKSDPKASEKTIFLVALENGKATEIDEVLAASNVVDKSAISSPPVLEEKALDIPCSSKASVSDLVEPPNCSTTDLAENNTESNSEARKLEEKDVMDNRTVLEINLESNPEMEKLEVHQVLENNNPETEKLEVHQVLENSNPETEKLGVHQVLENSNPEMEKLEVHQVLENSNPDTEKLEVHQVLENCNPERVKEEVQQVMTESSEPVKLQNSFCYSKMCAPTRRKISAIRQFPPGCGPACAAPSSSSDKSFVRVEIDQVSKHLVGEDSVKVVDDEALRGEMRSNEGKEVVKEVDIGISSKLAGKTDIISPKSNSLHQEMAGVSTLVGSTKKLLHTEENKPSLRQSTLIDGSTQMKGDENTLNHDNTMMKQTITIDESVKVLSSDKFAVVDRKDCRVTKEKEIIHERSMVRSNSDKNFRIQDLSGHVQVKTSLKSGSNKKTLLKSESNELLVCRSSEKTLESLKVVQTTQSILTKANASSLSPIVAKSQSETKRLNKGVTPSMEKPLGKENEIDQKSSKKRTFPDEISHKCYSPGEDDDPLDDIGEKMIILALMASKNCPWRNTMKRIAVSSDSSVPKSKIRRERRYADKTPTSKNYFASQHKRKGLIEDDDDTLEGGNDLSITMTPFAPPKSSQSDNEEVLARHKVMRVLRLFQLLCRKFLQGEESRSNKSGKTKRIDLLASGILKDKREWVNCSETIIGRVPGVEIGDEFHFRVELAIIGLHRPFQGGIDCTKKKGMLLATSIVASGGYQDDMDSSDVLIYSGSGGTSVVGGDKQKGHQKLERGNLALKNSISAQTPVRVIHGFKEKASESHDANARVKFVTTYIYDGLYYVESYWQEMNSDNYYVFKFQLRRMAQQPELAFKELKRSAKLKIREGLCVKDISQGKEKIGISVVNTIDTEQPMPFKYITKSIYPSWYAKTPPSGCDCINGCSDSDKCACAVKNGGEIPFNYNGAIVQAKKLIYECGPSCKCSSSCHNKVSQRGIKMQLEIFKTRGRGWGVRSLKSISSGTFICEYIGELLQDGEAEQRTNDEYLFDIGHNYDDRSLWEDLPNLIPGLQSSSQCDSVESVGFTIDAAEHGNVGRFINHSCSPNLYAQNVLYDHDDKRMPHIMFFAVDNIPPLQELTYHYNYTINEVRDSEGNIKQKACHCGSPECCGRLY